MSQLIEIELIEVGDRLRAIDDDYVAVLASSMKERGRVLQPIAVTSFFTEKALRPSYRLLAGAHRLAAAKQAGFSVIPAEVDPDTNPLEARLVEIDENLFRHDLNPLDRAIFLAERKRIYEELYPDTRAGVAGGKAGRKSTTDTMSAVPGKASFAEDAAIRTGLDPRTIRRAVSIATGLSAKVRKRLVGTAYASNQKELLLLAKQEPERQEQIVDLILNEADSVKSVKAAIERAGGKPRAVPDANHAQVKKLMDAWRHSGLTARRTFVRELSAGDRVLLQDLLDMATPDTEEAA
ncbi:ParB/RepB/Spo0J family partition protein [Thalassospira sp. MIT1370]|uniref:ParB/RepB/Spo0J family partition protein n=1 Tax=unclassified Thalassospira TaxID=2648997 RepID=UPI00399B2DB2